MRFNSRMKVDLPHPEGPMSAVTCLEWMSSEMPFRALVLP